MIELEMSARSAVFMLVWNWFCREPNNGLLLIFSSIREMIFPNDASTLLQTLEVWKVVSW